MAVRKSSLAAFAVQLARAHIRAIPCRNKKPLVRWKDPSTISADTWRWAESLAIVTGENNLIGFDFDGAAGAKLFETVRHLIPAGAYTERTPHGGVHVLFRCAGAL